MLAKRNRLLTAGDYRSTVRQGKRLTSDHVVVHWRPALNSATSRFGFIVSRAVGNAVARNTMRRRLKSICFSHLVQEIVDGRPAVDVVVRLLPGAAQAGWVSLEEHLSPLLAATLSPSVGSTSVRDRHRSAATHRTASE